MFAVPAAGGDPTDRGQRSLVGILIEVGDVGDILKLAILFDRVKKGQWIPDAGRFGILVYRRAVGGIIGAVGFRTGLDVVLPGDLILEEQVGQVGPGIVRVGQIKPWVLFAWIGKFIEFIDT